MLDVKGVMFVVDGVEHAFFRYDRIVLKLYREIIEQRYILEMYCSAGAMLDIEIETIEIRCKNRDIVMTLKDIYWIADDGVKAEVDLLIYRPKT